ncbi:hypothetical protein [Legionella cincinnatiensis]|uniref:hypothetical protein n=1 Tax=Legionella cincinnatiensis TaxID=28085 RepID=UPI0007312E8C|nr:hypothetical protein [Legionella cincinnatiensis]
MHQWILLFFACFLQGTIHAIPLANNEAAMDLSTLRELIECVPVINMHLCKLDTHNTTERNYSYPK